MKEGKQLLYISNEFNKIYFPTDRLDKILKFN